MWPPRLELATSILKTTTPDHMSCVAPCVKCHFLLNIPSNTYSVKYSIEVVQCDTACLMVKLPLATTFLFFYGNF